MDTVDVYVAFGWVCPKCESQNYNDGMRQEMTDEEKAIIEAQGDEEILDSEDSYWLAQPTNVTCKHCKVKFKVSGKTWEQG